MPDPTPTTSLDRLEQEALSARRQDLRLANVWLGDLLHVIKETKALRTQLGSMRTAGQELRRLMEHIPMEVTPPDYLLKQMADASREWDESLRALSVLCASVDHLPTEAQ